MPKKSKEINPFDGGWNNYSNPRDVEDNELPVAINIDCSVKGEISVRRPATETAITYTYVNGALNGYNSGEGLFVFQRDYNLAFSAKGDTTIYLLHIRDDDASANEESKVYAFTTFSSLSINALTAIYQFNDGDDDAVSVTLFNSDGNIRMCNSVLASDSAKSKCTQFYGGIEKVDFSTGNATIYNETKNNIIGKPYAGAFYTGSTSPTASTTEGTLNLYVKEVETVSNKFISFDSNAYYPLVLETDDVDSSMNSLNDSGNWPIQSSVQSQKQGGFGASFQERNSSNQYVANSYVKHPIGNGTSKIFAVNTDSGFTHIVGLSVASSKVQSFKDKSLFVDLWIAEECFDELVSPGIEIWIGNNVPVADGVEGDHYTFYVPSSETLKETWFTFECVYGNEDKIEGTPNPNAAQGVAILVRDGQSGNYGARNDPRWGFSFAIGAINLGTPSLGTWLGDYKFFYNWEYDDGQHSETFELTGQTDPLTIESKILELKTYTKIHSTAGSFLRRDGVSTSDTTVRITGANIFYAEYDKLGIVVDNDKRFLMNIDYGKGVRQTLFDDFTAFDTGTAPDPGKTHPALTITNPTSIDSFATVAGYSEGDKLNHIRFGSGIVLNNRSYVGNVAVMDKNDKIITYADRIYKSVAGQPDVYTKYDYLEVAPNDGESITALASYGDYLLEFKTYNMHLINITQDSEYLEESYAFSGVHDDHAVVKVNTGVCWANNFGLFLFDGKEVKNLLGIKIDREWWNINATNPTVAYDPIKDEVFVFLNKDGGAGIRYSFAKENFIYINSSSNTDFSAMTNAITEPSGQILFVGKNTTLKYNRFTDGDNHIDIKTRDDDLDDPGRQKSLKKVYINYKNNDATVPVIKYTKDNGAEKGFDTVFANTSGAYTTTAFKPSASADANNGFSFQIRIYGTADKSFVVNDINLIYREKSVK